MCNRGHFQGKYMLEYRSPIEIFVSKVKIKFESSSSHSMTIHPV